MLFPTLNSAPCLPPREAVCIQRKAFLPPPPQLPRAMEWHDPFGGKVQIPLYSARRGNPEKKFSASALAWDTEVSLSWNEGKHIRTGPEIHSRNGSLSFLSPLLGPSGSERARVPQRAALLLVLSAREGTDLPGFLLHSSLFADSILFDSRNCLRAIILVSFLEMGTYRALGPLVLSFLPPAWVCTFHTLSFQSGHLPAVGFTGWILKIYHERKSQNCIVTDAVH